jgi:hypothetical protein
VLKWPRLQGFELNSVQRGHKAREIGLFNVQKSEKPIKIKGLMNKSWMRGQDLRLLPSGWCYESEGAARSI